MSPRVRFITRPSATGHAPSFQVVLSLLWRLKSWRQVRTMLFGTRLWMGTAGKGEVKAAGSLMGAGMGADLLGLVLEEAC